MTRIFIDTSAWLPLLNAAEADHPAVASVYADPGHEWFTSNFVIDELLTLLHSRCGHGAAVRAGRALRSGIQARVVRVQPEDEEQAWSTFQKFHGLSFTDGTSFAVMRRLGIATALTLDSDFGRQGFVVMP